MEVSFSSSSADCYRRERVGFKHFFTSIRETLTVEGVAGCSEECIKSSYCVSFSYRSAAIVPLNFLFKHMTDLTSDFKKPFWSARLQSNCADVQIR